MPARRDVLPGKVPRSTPAKTSTGRLEEDWLLIADRNFFNWADWCTAADSGAQLLWRVKAGLTLPVLELLPDGSYSSVLVNPKIRGKARQALIEAARAGKDLDEEQARHVRVVEYEVPDRDGDGKGEVIALVTLSALICRAATEAGIDPDWAKFKRAVRIVRRRAAGPAAFPLEHRERILEPATTPTASNGVATTAPATPAQPRSSWSTCTCLHSQHDQAALACAGPANCPGLSRGGFTANQPTTHRSAAPRRPAPSRASSGHCIARHPARHQPIRTAAFPWKRSGTTSTSGSP